MTEYKMVKIGEYEFYTIDDFNITVNQSRNTELYTKVNDNLWYMNNFINIDQLLDISGHNSNQIDSAVPQDWYEDYHKIHGKYPRACWTYENNLFGEPLFIEDVLKSLAQIIKDMINKGEYEIVNIN